MVAAPLVDLSTFRTGKLPAKRDERSLKIEHYIDLSVFAGYPKTQKWDRGITDFGMAGNDFHGDCVYAGQAHATQIMTANNGQEVTIPDQAVLEAYSVGTGFDPVTGANDNGANMLDALKQWRTSGIGGHTIGAFTTVNPKNQNMVKAVIDLFGFIYIGLALPVSAQNQRIWSVTKGPNAAPGGWGGHCVTVPDYDGTSDTCITWAHLLKMTDGFFTRYVDEAYAVLSPEWVNGQNVAPNGVNMAQLVKDLAMVTG